MDEPNWPKILQEIYRKQEHWQYFGEGEPQGYHDEDHPLRENTDLTGKELEAGVSFLTDMGLVEEKDDGFLYLTEEGFDVIRQRELQTSNLVTNRALVFFTLILAISTVFDSMVGLYGLEEWISTSLAVIMVGAILSLYYLTRKQRWFDIE